ncbi:VOC family protein [Paraburkholderia sp. CNPSo 3274]|uniref:VOC family protein n=1 Tax=Paraburkholderia sp. CNPSo 3274 TaxID=2940932 RepID=UPI0020B69599|nr:VOC family protein [Paraburkholderia sp. CNPSo 3274]MCP3708860.1 VOC family protein [Paraburkholderia sp. CNPSo 3274]
MKLKLFCPITPLEVSPGIAARIFSERGGAGPLHCVGDAENSAKGAQPGIFSRALRRRRVADAHRRARAREAVELDSKPAWFEYFELPLRGKRIFQATWALWLGMTHLSTTTCRFGRLKEITMQSTDTPTPPRKFAHFVLRTSRYDEVVNFYKALLSVHLTFSNDFVSFLTYDEEHHRIAVLNVSGLQDQQRGIAGVHHIAFTHDSLTDLVANYERAKLQGIEPVWCTNHGPTTSFYYRDPDGNQLELQVENFATVEESIEFMHSPEFAENAIGVDFDPEELARRLRAGEPEGELKKRPHSGPRGFDAQVKIF